MEETGGGFRVLMFPWLAHGHISPFFGLSKKFLTNKNCRAYFCSTKVNLCFVKKIFYDETSSNHSIEFVELHLPESPELPPHYHTTKNLPSHLIPKLVGAFQAAKSSFDTILSTVSPDLLIYDGFQSWAAAMAAEKNIPAVHFHTSGAASMAFFYHLHTYQRRDNFPFPSLYLREPEQSKLEALLESSREVAEDFAIGCFRLSTEIVLFKSSREVEAKYLDYLSSQCGKEMVALGPLIQESKSQEDDNRTDIINFLNSKDQSSVVYVSFGSEYFLSEEEREEMAYGLELSNVNFIWVVRFPVGHKISIEEAVPKGFLDRIKGKGIVVDGWAPQAKILEHKSTGGLVSHCGWGSVVESLHFGVPMIAMPMHLDQLINGRLLEEIGVGMEVLRDENGMRNREGIANVVKLVVLEKAGEGMRGKAGELSRNLRLKGEEQLNEATERLWNLCSKYKQASSGKGLEPPQQDQAPGA